MSDDALGRIRGAFGMSSHAAGPHTASADAVTMEYALRYLPALDWKGHTLFGDPASISAVREALRELEELRELQLDSAGDIAE